MTGALRITFLMSTLEPGVWSGGIYDFSPDHCEERFDALDLIQGNGHVILGKYRDIGEFARLERAAFRFIKRKPRAADRVGAQCILPRRRLLGPARRCSGFL